MKNSLFKRAVATVAAVPVALTQCLTIANAVDATDAAGNELTLAGETGLLTIAPEDGYTKNADGNYEKISEWNFTVSGVLAQAKGKSGKINPQKIYDMAANKAGKYTNLVKDVTANKIGDITFVVEDNGDITVTAPVANVASSIEADAKAQLSERYADKPEVVEAINNADIFAGVDISGEFTIVIKSSALATGTEVEAELTYTCAEGKFQGAGLAGYAKTKLAELKAAADKALASTVEEYDLADGQLDAYLNDFSAKVDLAVSKTAAIDKLDLNGTCGTTAELIAVAKAKAAKSASVPAFVKNKVANMPSSASGIMASNLIADMYSQVLTQINNAAAPYAVNITAADLGAAADTLTDITYSVNSKSATLSAKMVDAEAAAAEAYIMTTYNLDSAESWKEVDVEVTYGEALGAKVAVDVQLKRVVKPGAEKPTEPPTDPPTPTEPPTDPPTPTEPPTDAPTTKETIYKITYDTKSTYGFYLTIDEAYDLGQIVDLSATIQKQIMTKDENGAVLSIVNDGEAETVDLKNKVNYGDQKPSDKTENNVLAARNVIVYAAEDVKTADGTVVIAKGDTLKDEEGVAFGVEAYVAVKGDANFDGMVDAGDGSRVLWIYAELSTNGGKTDAVTYAQSELVPGPTHIYDELCAFLIDVDSENVAGNYCVKKANRTIDSADASFILAAYAASSTNGGVLDRAVWNDVLGEFAKK